MLSNLERYFKVDPSGCFRGVVMFFLLQQRSHMHVENSGSQKNCALLLLWIGIVALVTEFHAIPSPEAEN